MINGAGHRSRKDARAATRGALTCAAGVLALAAPGCQWLLDLDGNPRVTCEAGERDCSGNTPRVCMGGVWEEEEPCEDRPPVCSGGVCDAQPACSGGACQAIRQVAAGGSTTCTLLGDGSVWCWGLNEQGQCGRVLSRPATNADQVDATPRYQLRPARVPLPGGATGIAVGGDASSGHACAVVDGSVWCWGDNRYSQTGAPREGENTGIPGRIDGIPGRVERVRAGFERTCVILAPGPAAGARELWCWGHNTVGQTIPGGEDEIGTPTQLSAPELEDVEDVALGLTHTCGLVHGKVFCWGDEAAFECDEASEDTAAGLHRVPFREQIVSSIAAGDRHTCAMTDAGVFCWGVNRCGQVDDDGACDAQCSEPGAPDAATCCAPPRLVEPLDPALALGEHRISAGAEHTCLSRPPGDVKCWGHNGDKQVDPFDSSRRKPVTERELGNLDATELALGSHHSCVLQTGGQIQCWGGNENGQLGQDKASDDEIPQPVKWYGE